MSERWKADPQNFRVTTRCNCEWQKTQHNEDYLIREIKQKYAVIPSSFAGSIDSPMSNRLAAHETTTAHLDVFPYFGVKK